jgi:L-alanine-DL-glutamate epimerase-like enolase superfamily enzyme
VVAGAKVLKSPEVFTIEDGMILAPKHPGLGLDVDEEAIERFRTRG